MVLPLLASYAAKKTLSYVKNKAQNQGRVLALKAQNKAKQFAAQKARQMANAAKRQANTRISGMVQKHMGNNARARALSNQLKTHISGKINTVHAATQNQIKAAPKFNIL
jgi:hypothetical protein